MVKEKRCVICDKVIKGCRKKYCSSEHQKEAFDNLKKYRRINQKLNENSY